MACLPLFSQAQWFAENDTFSTNSRFMVQTQGNYFLNSNSVPVHVVSRFLFGGTINQKSINHINNKNGTARLGFDASYGFSFKWRSDSLSKRFYFTSFNDSYLGGARLSNQLLQLGLNGNSYFDEQQINFEPLKFRFYQIQSLDFGMGFQSKKWIIAPSVGLSRLINYNQIHINSLGLYSSIDSLNYQIDAQSINSNGNKLENNGIAIQTGINLTYHHENWWLNASVQRLGLVVNNWQVNENNYQADTSFTGFRVNDLNSLSVFNIEDSLNNLVNQSERNIKRQGMALPASFQLRISKLLNKSTDVNLYFIHAGMAYQSSLLQTPLVYLSGEWQMNTNHRFSLEGIVFTGPYSAFDGGLKLGYSILNKHALIRLAAPSLSGFINPKRFGNSSLHIQLAYQW